MHQPLHQSCWWLGKGRERRTGEGRRVLSPRSEEVSDASWIMIPSGKSEWSFSPLGHICPSSPASFKRPSYLSTQPAEPIFPVRPGSQVVQRGSSTGKNSPGKVLSALTKLTNNEKTFGRTKAAAYCARYSVSNVKSSPQSDLSRPTLLPV